MDLCTPADVHSFGIARGSIPNPAKPVAVDAVADTLTLELHGLSAGDPVKFRAEAGDIPRPLVAGLKYYALPVDESVFQISGTANGSAIDLETPGSRVLVIFQSPIAAAISFVSRLIEDSLPAHVVPLTNPVPDIVRMTAAELAGARVRAMTGVQSEAFGPLLDEAMKRLDKWARGVPVRDANATEAANLAAAASVAVPLNDSRGWGRYGGP
jgi:hypothetical protein